MGVIGRPRASRAASRLEALVLGYSLALFGLTTLAAGAVLSERAATPPVSGACPKSQCAMVDSVHTSPVLTQFYGRSCQGLHGAWFMNVAQGGGNQILHPSYRLNWAFANASSSALPSGFVTFSQVGQQKATATLSDGVLRITGTGPTGSAVSGQGRLTVQLSGSYSAPTLTVTETGLSNVDRQLGFDSPFVVNGAPVTVPIRLVPTVPGCNSH